MYTLGRILQLAGLAITGYAAFRAFWTDFSEGQFITIGFGGFAVFLAGQWLCGRAP